MTQTLLAKLAEVSPISICRYETGRNMASPSVKRKLADALHVDISYFEEEEPKLFDVSAQDLDQQIAMLRKLILGNRNRRRVVSTLITALILKYSNQKVQHLG